MVFLINTYVRYANISACTCVQSDNGLYCMLYCDYSQETLLLLNGIIQTEKWTGLFFILAGEELRSSPIQVHEKRNYKKK